MKKQTKKLVIKWFQVETNGEVSAQVRVYKNEEDAWSFVEKLKERGILKCSVNVIYDVNFRTL